MNKKREKIVQAFLLIEEIYGFSTADILPSDDFDIPLEKAYLQFFVFGIPKTQLPQITKQMAETRTELEELMYQILQERFLKKEELEAITKENKKHLVQLENTLDTFAPLLNGDLQKHIEKMRGEYEKLLSEKNNTISDLQKVNQDLKELLSQKQKEAVSPSKPGRLFQRKKTDMDKAAAVIENERRQIEFEQFAANIANNGNYNEEQKLYLFSCLKSGQRYKDILRFADPGLSIDLMKALGEYYKQLT